MPSYKVLKAAVAGLARAYLSYYGPMSLAPKRAEPMKFSMVREVYAIPSSPDSPARMIGNLSWSDSDHHVFMFRRLICAMKVTAFRLGEIVGHTSGKIMYLTFESLAWVIGGIMISRPTAAQLASLRPGIDGASARAWHPLEASRIRLVKFTALSASSSPTIRTTPSMQPPRCVISNFEWAAPCRTAELLCYSAIRGANLTRTTFSTHSSLLGAALTHLYGPAVASLYSFHSFRSGFATALHAAGVPEHAMIQLICRWKGGCAPSRMGVAEQHETDLRRAST